MPPSACLTARFSFAQTFRWKGSAVSDVVWSTKCFAGTHLVGGHRPLLMPLFQGHCRVQERHGADRAKTNSVLSSMLKKLLLGCWPRNSSTFFSSFFSQSCKSATWSDMSVLYVSAVVRSQYPQHYGQQVGVGWSFSWNENLQLNV